MPNQLDLKWDTSTWPQRYILASLDVNYYLSGLQPVVDGKHWTKDDVRRFVAWIKPRAQTVDKDEVVMYRGTWDAESAPAHDNPTLAFTSMTHDKHIATEFSGKKGSVHALHLKRGCRVFDMEPHYAAGNAVRREREVLLLPGHRFVFRRKYGGVLHWDVHVLPSRDAK